MGACLAKTDPNSVQIEKDIKQKKLDQSREIKLLLLGAGKFYPLTFKVNLENPLYSNK